MKLSDLQQWVAKDWDEHSPKKPDPHLQLLYMIEEFGEVAEAIRKNQGDKKRKDVSVDLEGELGDLLITICTLANTYGVDLEKSASKAQAKITKRHQAGH
jgi:NTP pyrophosphatase (non-canonical NTP hydrolase)